jgi:hypothetical protein
MEMEVWAVIEGCWDAWDAREDVDSWKRDCMHEEATYYFSTDAAPFRNDWPMKAGPLWFERHDETRSVYDLRPLAITVVDDVAIVHYYARIVSMVDGVSEGVRHKTTEALIRQNGKWMVLGKHVTPVE